jgi:hypothetical protein
MARVTVFVDDVVRGDLPMLCVKDGAAATRRAQFEERVDGMNPIWWILVFFGPLGWIGLLLVTGRGGATLTARLPVCDETLRVWTARRRARWVALGGVAAAIALALFVPWTWPRVVVAVATVFVIHWRYTMDGVGLHLDASRRWVVLTGVAPAFAQAIEADRLADRRR